MPAKSLPGFLLILTACGSVTTTGGPDAGDAPEADAGPVPDPDATPEPCDLTQPFGALQPLTSLNTSAHEQFATLSPDELTIYFSSNRLAPGTAQVDIYVATRTSREEEFGAPVNLAVVNHAGDDRSPSISADGLELYFHSSRSGDYEIYVSTRTTIAAAFSAPVPLGPGVNTAGIETSPSVTAGGSVLYFDRPDLPGEPHLWRATRGPTGFGAAVEVAAVSAPSSKWAVPTEDDLTLYFGSNRPGTAGSDDVWVATRATTNDPFGAVTGVAGLNTALSEALDWVSPDGCRAYVGYEISTGTQSDLYVAARPE
jgi:hypothetical protein